MTTRRPFFFLSLALLAASCSSTLPVQTATPATNDCAAIAAAMAKSTQDMQAAQERRANAWKVVVPFAVAARYAQAGSDAEAAERQLASLRAQATAAGCSSGS